MHKTDFLSIDGRLLRLFLTIYDHKSVSKAAQILDINQSSASHGLDRLRKIVNDPLFVRSGRGLSVTERAEQVAIHARVVLSQLEHLSEESCYNPVNDFGEFTIMANCYEIYQVVKPVFQLIRKKAPNITLRIIQAVSGLDIPRILREGAADIVLNPDIDIDAPDIQQKRLFTESDVVYYDPNIRSAPITIEEYCSAPHAKIVLGDIKKTDIDTSLSTLSRKRKIVLKASSFATLATLLEGTDIIATMPSMFANNIFKQFSYCKPPMQLTSYSIVQLWHTRNNNSERNQWFRNIINESVENL